MTTPEAAAEEVGAPVVVPRPAHVARTTSARLASSSRLLQGPSSADEARSASAGAAACVSSSIGCSGDVSGRGSARSVVDGGVVEGRAGAGPRPAAVGRGPPTRPGGGRWRRCHQGLVQMRSAGSRHGRRGRPADARWRSSSAADRTAATSSLSARTGAEPAPSAGGARSSRSSTDVTIARRVRAVRATRSTPAAISTTPPASPPATAGSDSLPGARTRPVLTTWPASRARPRLSPAGRAASRSGP